jgi:hypothetical protein
MKKRNDSSVLSNLIFRVWNLFYSQQKGLDEYIYKKKKKKKKVKKKKIIKTFNELVFFMTRGCKNDHFFIFLFLYFFLFFFLYFGCLLPLFLALFPPF